MDRVFPENMNPINLDNTKQSLSTLESYLRYMRERIEYSITILTKLNSGTSVADLASRVAQLETRTSGLTSTVASLSARVGELQGKFITGSSDPSSSTNATYGAIYVNTTTGDVFICSGENPVAWTMIPTAISDLPNDAGYLTLSTLPVYDGGTT